MNKINIEEKKSRRFLRQVAGSAAIELEKLRDIPDSPASLDYFYDILEAVFISNEPEKVFSDYRDPVFIGLYCMLVPEELVYAAGAVPVRLCAGSFDASQAGEDLVPRDACPLVKSAMGFSAQNGLRIFDQCDVVIVPTTCDCKRKMGEELADHKNVWMLEVPHIKDAVLSREIWLEQVYALKSLIEKHVKKSRSGHKITPRRLGRAINDIAGAQAEIRKLLSIRSSSVPAIWGRQATAVFNSYAYAPADKWSKALENLNNELCSRSVKGFSICREDTPRILIAGSPSIFPNMKIASLVEEMGGIVVYDESCTGDRYLYDPVGNIDNSPGAQMTGLASRYMAPCVCPSFAPNEDRVRIIQRIADSYSVDGTLYHVLKGCISYDFEVLRLEKTLKTEGIPMLRIETDYNPEDVEQLRTRIEAFIEMLKTGKRKRGLQIK
ncbi:MAG: 2-hydroxyacyl-CoA dehydratase family protein [Desulfobacteraceae bacterium]|jgi:benzoyl-CoA reductase/2-hydroxyglutaryl-CoA dehydratase subunit BcrC/BadD/HgdB